MHILFIDLKILVLQCGLQQLATHLHSHDASFLSYEESFSSREEDQEIDEGSMILHTRIEICGIWLEATKNQPNVPKEDVIPHGDVIPY